MVKIQWNVNVLGLFNQKTVHGDISADDVLSSTFKAAGFNRQLQNCLHPFAWYLNIGDDSRQERQ